MGDFNACTEMLNEENKNKLDDCGKIILSWIDEFNLTILNLEDNCEGVYTWSRGNLKSAVDYILINDIMYSQYLGMKIDEHKEELDLSDHCLVTVKFETKDKNSNNKGNRWIRREYFTKDEEALSTFAQEVVKDWEEKDVETVAELNKSMKDIARKILLRTYKRREDSQRKEEKPWINEEIRN